MLTAPQMTTASDLAEAGRSFMHCRDVRAMVHRPDYLAMVQTAWTFLDRVDALLAETHGESWHGLDTLKRLDRGVIQATITALTAAALERFDMEMRRPLWESLGEVQKHAKILAGLLTASEALHAKAHVATGAALPAKPPAMKKLTTALSTIVDANF